MGATFPFGFESPLAFYLTLYVLTFVLNVIFMTYVLAGSLYVAWATVFPGQQRVPQNQQPLAAILREWMPFVLSGAITAGVAPLLFVQIIYREQFYTANLLLGRRWLVVIPVLIVAFYLLYVLKSKMVARWSLAARCAVAIGVASCFLFVAFCWTTNHLLGVNSANWPEVYRTGSFVASLPSALLRLLTLVAGAFSTMTALAGCQLWGQFRSSEVAPHDVEVRRMATLSVASLTMAAVFGVIYTMQLDGPIQNNLIGRPGLAWLSAVVVGVVTQIAAWIFILRKATFVAATLAVITVGNIVALAGTAALRKIVRLSQIDLSRITVHVREAWAVGGFSLFLVAALIVSGLIILCVYLTRSAWRNESSTIG
jgi:hypothetical protein